MTTNPGDLLNWRSRIMKSTGLSAVEVGIMGDGAHARTGGYHEGKDVLASIGAYHSPASQHVGASSEDYSARLSRDRAGLTNEASAVDVGSDWGFGGHSAWLRFNNLLYNALLAGDMDLTPIRAINFSRDGVERKRADRQYGFGNLDSTSDSVTIHTHIEFYRDTAGTRWVCLAKLDTLISQAIYGVVPTPPPAPLPIGEKMLIAKKPVTGELYLCDGIWSRPIPQASVGDIIYLAQQGLLQLGAGTPGAEWDSTGRIRLGWNEVDFGTVPAAVLPVALTAAQLTELATEIAADLPAGITTADVTTAITSALNRTGLQVS